MRRGAEHGDDLVLGRCPCVASKMPELGQIDSMPSSSSMPSASACAFTRWRWCAFEAADETRLAVVDDCDTPLRAEVELLERRPVLRSQAEHVEAKPNHP